MGGKNNNKKKSVQSLMSTVWEYSAINFYQDPKHQIFYSEQDKLGFLSYTQFLGGGGLTCAFFSKEHAPKYEGEGEFMTQVNHAGQEYFNFLILIILSSARPRWEEHLKGSTCKDLAFLFPHISSPLLFFLDGKLSCSQSSPRILKQWWIFF